jgi:hypothetical protein
MVALWLSANPLEWYVPVYTSNGIALITMAHVQLHGAGHEYLPLAGEFEIKMSDIVRRPCFSAALLLF